MFFIPNPNCLFVSDFGIEGVSELNRAALARIHRAAINAVAQQRVFIDIQPLDDRCAQRVIGVIEWKFQFSQAQHRAAIVA
jgi:hypothetical protein